MLKGHLGQKSSPLAPTSCKLSKQMLVLQHMNSHYKKLSNVKSSIDMSCPKTLSTSVRSRDTRGRRGGASGRRPGSRQSSRPSSRMSTDDNHFSSNQAFADDPDLDQIVRENLAESESAPVTPSATPGRYKPPPSPYGSARPSSSRRALYEGTNRRPPNVGNSSVRAWLSRPEDTASVGGQSMSGAAAADGGDIIDCHAAKFTESRPFTPRTLRKNVPSKLSQFRYYNKPKSAGRRKPEQPRREQEDVRPEQPRVRSEAADVPALPIDADPDKVRWLEQQAEKAKLRQEVSASARPYGSPDVETQTRTLRDFDVKDMSAPEEELKYLEFYSDVTNDVLNRGIFTNKVLNQVFQYHLEKNKNNLRMSKMHEILNNIRRELGIPDNEDLDDSFGYGVVRPLHYPPESRRRADPEDESPAPRFSDFPAHRPLTDHDIMRFKMQARETERQLSSGSYHPINAGVSEESDLKVCLTTDELSGLDGEARDIAPHAEGVDESAAAGSQVSFGEKREERVSHQRDEVELLSTQDEVEMTQLHETMRRTMERQRENSVSSVGGPERDEPDAGAEKEEFEAQHWSNRTTVDEAIAEAGPGQPSRFSEPGAQSPLHDLDRTDSISEPPTPTTRNLMTMTLRPGMFNTLIGQPSEEESPTPAARARLGKSVTFASQDELLETGESENNATLTDVSAPALDMSEVRRSLPSEYEDDFEDEDGF